MKPKGQSRMDNPETQVTKDTTQGEDKQYKINNTQNKKKIGSMDPPLFKLSGVSPGAHKG